MCAVYSLFFYSNNDVILDVITKKDYCMSKKEKMLNKISNNPVSVSFDEISKLLKDNGFEIRRPSGGSSHATFCKGKYLITIPYAKPIKTIYVKNALTLIEKSNESED